MEQKRDNTCFIKFKGRISIVKDTPMFGCGLSFASNAAMVLEKIT